MTESQPSDRFVFLCSGAVVPVDALRLAWNLEERGFSFLVEDGDLFIKPYAELDPADLEALKDWRRHIIAIVQYGNAPWTDRHLRRFRPAPAARVSARRAS